METSETEYEQNGERERIANNFIVIFWTLQKTKISPHWWADCSRPEWRHR